MALSNYDRIGKGMEMLRDGLAPFVEREMEAVHDDKWRQIVADGAGKKAKVPEEGETWDVHLLLSTLWNNWNSVFGKTLGHFERSLVSELRDARNKWAHQEQFSTDDAHRHFDSMHRLLQSVGAEEAREVDKQRQELLRIRFDEQARKRQRKAAQESLIEGQPTEGLKAWREVVTPHRDVASGYYQQAEFAADLGQVHRGEAGEEYQDPVQFYRRTYITDGLHRLLVNALRRLGGNGGDPVVELQTNFGGGKTHSMLALYHLFGGKKPGDLAGIDEILQEAEVDHLPKAKTAVLVGTALPVGQVRTKSDGTEVHTLWGELAWELGAYDQVEESDRQGVSPGSEVLEEIFKQAGPCLILIDEWVAQARQLVGKDGLPAGSLAANISFAQALTEAARRAPETLVVVTVPESDIETGGEAGTQVLAQLKNVLGRMDSPWRPASGEESFEIVRRRLFDDIGDQAGFQARDAVARAFVEHYRSQKGDFPAACGEGEYERRIKACYPIHPELFDRLFEDWSSLDRFQRTRGVLRLMAKVIHSLWEGNDKNLLILPGFVPLDDPEVHEELSRYLDEPWKTVIEVDVDGPNSLPFRMDREFQNLGRFSACRRVARTLFLGSAATHDTANRGLEDLRIRLGCCQPGEPVAVFGDALRRLTDQAHHLYVDGKRYWYSTQPSVARKAQDRAEQLSADDVAEEIRRRLRDEQGQRGDFHRVHVCPESSADVVDEREVRLVILDPELSHNNGNEESSALAAAQEILDQRGSGPRRFRNALIFLAADGKRAEELERAVRSYLAWKSIHDEREDLNLDAHSARQAESKKAENDDTVRSRIGETYCLMLVPEQPDKNGEMTWKVMRVQGEDSLAKRASRKLIDRELLIPAYSGVRLKQELDRIPLWRGDHVEVVQLADDFAQYLYLDRLRDPEVLTEAIQDGVNKTSWEQDTFAYAQGYDDAKGRYEALEAGRLVGVQVGGGALVVKSDVAAKQIAAESGATTEGQGDEPDSPPEQPSVVEERYTGFNADKELEAERIARDIQQINDEVLQHLTSLPNTRVTARLIIHADLVDGIDDRLVRTINENCSTLKFRHFEFEKE